MRAQNLAHSQDGLETDGMNGCTDSTNQIIKSAAVKLEKIISSKYMKVFGSKVSFDSLPPERVIASIMVTGFGKPNALTSI